MQESFWKLRENLATLASGSLEARFDTVRPGLGLTGLAYSGEQTEHAALFKIGSGERPKDFAECSGDVYVRGKDLIVTYEKTEQRPLRVQLLWRALPPTHAAQAMGIELIVSVQTDLLDSNPELRITSIVPAMSVRRLCAADNSRFDFRASVASPGTREFLPSPGGFLFQVDRKISYLEMVHPSDFREVSIASSSISTKKPFTAMYDLRTRLFSERLEKGVILRSRLRGYLVAGETDEVVAKGLYREFTASEPPLTA